MRVYHAITLLSSLLFLLGAAPLQDEEVEFIPAFPSDVVTCDNNEPNIQLLEVVIAENEKAIIELRIKLDSKKIEEKENAELLKLEIESIHPKAKLAFRKFFIYYCDNPDKLPKPPEPELELSSLV